MYLSTAVWHILNGKPIPKKMRSEVIDVLRSQPNYLKKTTKIAEDDYEEKLDPKIAKYAEEYRRSPNQSGDIYPKFIMLHHTSGSFWGSVDWILRKISKVSYHYIINPKDGSRIQFVWDNKKAWHAGKTSWEGFTGLNSYSIGIAFDGDTNKRTVSNLEIDSCARKCIYLMDKFDIPKERIITHKMAAPKRKNDCSDAVHARVMARIKELLK